MDKIKEFLKVNYYVITWSICYATAIFLILLLMFDFNILSSRDWSILMRAQLRGFPGFVFGLLILSAVPMYIATTIIIMRTKKPIFEIFPEKKKEEKKEESKKDTDVTEEIIALPDNIPSELVGAFLRARKNIANLPGSDFDIKNVYTEPEPVAAEQVPDTPAAGLPLPEDFDFAMANGDSPEHRTAPVFKEITFGDESDKKEDAKPVSDKKTILKTDAKDSKISGNVSLVNGMALATHDDSDFWIADDEHWFASGKQKESPIAMALEFAQQNNVPPAIYLAEKNIMDLDNQIEKWKSMGIKVITDPDELKDAVPELVKSTV